MEADETQGGLSSEHVYAGTDRSIRETDDIE